MHQTRKGEQWHFGQWHFGMKAHIGVDVASGVVHTLTGTAADEADINQMAAVLPDIAGLVERHGAGLTVIEWAARLRCSRCGMRKANFGVTGERR